MHARIKNIINLGSKNSFILPVIFKTGFKTKKPGFILYKNQVLKPKNLVLKMIKTRFLGFKNL